jgi:hypothetical protein
MSVAPAIRCAVLRDTPDRNHAAAGRGHGPGRVERRLDRADRDRPVEVIVGGYGGEPYLRVTTAGVWQNDLSATGYLNQSLFVDTSALNGKPASAAPTWRRTGLAGTARWHDHRIHWMGVSRPPGVAADPSHRHLIGNWTIPARAGPKRFTIRGTLNWIGKPDQMLGMPTGIGVLLTVVLIGSVRRLGAGPGRPPPRSTR